MISYASSSPYYATKITNNVLGTFVKRTFSFEADDILYRIEPEYEHRPDLLAADLYNDSALWWVFAARNPNIIKDPVFDFVPGRQIYLPKQTNLSIALGL